MHMYSGRWLETGFRTNSFSFTALLSLSLCLLFLCLFLSHRFCSTAAGVSVFASPLPFSYFFPPYFPAPQCFRLPPEQHAKEIDIKNQIIVMVFKEENKLYLYWRCRHKLCMDCTTMLSFTTFHNFCYDSFNSFTACILLFSRQTPTSNLIRDSCTLSACWCTSSSSATWHSAV